MRNTHRNPDYRGCKQGRQAKKAKGTVSKLEFKTSVSARPFFAFPALDAWFRTVG